MRKIVILFHSFGSFLLINYLNKYGGSKISGLVDLAGIPITMYNRFNLMSKLLYKYKK